MIPGLAHPGRVLSGHRFVAIPGLARRAPVLPGHQLVASLGLAHPVLACLLNSSSSGVGGRCILGNGMKTVPLGMSAAAGADGGAP